VPKKFWHTVNKSRGGGKEPRGKEPSGEQPSHRGKTLNERRGSKPCHPCNAGSYVLKIEKGRGRVCSRGVLETMKRHGTVKVGQKIILP